MRSKRMRKKRFPIFWVLYLVFVGLIVFGCTAVYNYVYDSLVLYESHQPINYITAWTEDFSSGSPIADFAEKNVFSGEHISEYDNAEMAKEEFYSLFKNSKITFEQDKTAYDAELPAYNFFTNGKEFMQVTLSPVNTETRLGIMTFSEWIVSGIELYMGGGVGAAESDGSYSYSAVLPNLYTLYINGKPVAADGAEGDIPEEFSVVSAYTEVPKMVTVKAEGMYFDPKVEMTDNLGEKIEFTSNGGKCEIAAKFMPSAEGEAMAAAVDVMEKARTWSKFLTDDIGGARHGVAEVQKFLIKDSYLWDMSYAFSRGIDITFVSPHTIVGFENEKITNCIKYSDDFFSCDVYFEKRMKINGVREERVDIFNSRMYFVKITDGETAAWYLADMQSIVSEDS